MAKQKLPSLNFQQKEWIRAGMNNNGTSGELPNAISNVDAHLKNISDQLTILNNALTELKKDEVWAGEAKNDFVATLEGCITGITELYTEYAKLHNAGPKKALEKYKAAENNVAREISTLKN